MLYQSSATARDVVPPPPWSDIPRPRQRGLKSHARFVFVTRGGIANMYVRSRSSAHLSNSRWGGGGRSVATTPIRPFSEAARSARCQTTPFCFYIKIFTLTRERKNTRVCVIIKLLILYTAPCGPRTLSAALFQ